MRTKFLNGWLAWDRGFFRLGNSRFVRLVIVHKRNALFTERTHGWPVGDWYLYIGK